MRDYGKVHTSFWTSSTIRGMSEDARTLAFYLLTCPHGNIAGTFRLPNGYACDDLQWPVERVSEGFAELFDKGFARRCERTFWVWLTKHFDWNRPENPNQQKAACKIVDSIPGETTWLSDFLEVSREFTGSRRVANRNGCETLSEPLPNQEQEQEQEQEQDSGAPPARQSRKSKIGTWLDSLPEGEDAIRADDPIFTYATDAGIPVEYLELSWARFCADMAERGTLKTDWRAHYRNAVRGNWYKLWWFDGDVCQLTTAGKQAQRAGA